MNLPQRIVLALGTIAITAIVAFPSWIYVYHYEPISHGVGFSPQHIERPAGYHAIWAVHVPTDETALGNLFSIAPLYDRLDLKYFSMRLDKDRLWIQLIGVIVVTALLTLLLKDRRR